MACLGQGGNRDTRGQGGGSVAWGKVATSWGKKGGNMWGWGRKAATCGDGEEKAAVGGVGRRGETSEKERDE
jgi:hypothetical protein